MVTASQLLRNKELIDQALANANGLCIFCETEIKEDLEWHHVKGPKKYVIADIKRIKTPNVLAAELEKCRPAHGSCHDSHHREHPRLGE